MIKATSQRGIYSVIQTRQHPEAPTANAGIAIFDGSGVKYRITTSKKRLRAEIKNLLVARFRAVKDEAEFTALSDEEYYTDRATQVATLTKPKAATLAGASQVDDLFTMNVEDIP